MIVPPNTDWLKITKKQIKIYIIVDDHRIIDVF